MSYAVKEIFLTLQGEGAHAGRAAVFCRFSGCNLWSGREQDRAGAVCNFCDTDFVGLDGPGGGRFASAADARVVIPIKPGLRSLNVAMSVAMALGEALRQIDAGMRETKG